jgi:hypothetical protein
MDTTIDSKIPDALPAAVGAWVSQSSQALIESLGEDLEALILFGSAAEGLMRASSDGGGTAGCGIRVGRPALRSRRDPADVEAALQFERWRMRVE